MNFYLPTLLHRQVPKPCAFWTAAFTLAFSLILSAAPTHATPVQVLPKNMTSCDNLGLQPNAGDSRAAADELGTSGFPQDETIRANWNATDHVACPMARRMKVAERVLRLRHIHSLWLRRLAPRAPTRGWRKRFDERDSILWLHRHHRWQIPPC